MKKIYSVVALALAWFGIASAVSAETIDDSGQIFLANPGTVQEHRFNSDMPGGRRYEVSHHEGMPVTDNVDSPLYLTSITHRAGRLVETDEKTGEEKLLFRWMMMDATDREGNQVFFWGEHNPPEAPVIRVTEGTGKYAGIRGTLNMAWEPDAVYPAGPKGTIRLDYDIQFSLNGDDPSRHGPIHGGMNTDAVIREKWSPLEYTVANTPHYNRFTLPNGNLYIDCYEQGFIFTEDKDHPLYGMHVAGPNIAVLEPEAAAKLEAGTLRMEECCIYQLGVLVKTNVNGDQIYVMFENRPGVGVTWREVKGTGQFEGVKYIGRSALYGRPVQEEVFFVKEQPDAARSPSFADSPGRSWANGRSLILSYVQFELPDRDTN